jgi:hypothetical protein
MRLLRRSHERSRILGQRGTKAVLLPNKVRPRLERDVVVVVDVGGMEEDVVFIVLCKNKLSYACGVCWGGGGGLRRGQQELAGSAQRAAVWWLWWWFVL